MTEAKENGKGLSRFVDRMLEVRRANFGTSIPNSSQRRIIGIATVPPEATPDDTYQQVTITLEDNTTMFVAKTGTSVMVRPSEDGSDEILFKKDKNIKPKDRTQQFFVHHQPR